MTCRNYPFAETEHRDELRQGILQYLKTFWSKREGRKREAILMANIKTMFWTLGLLGILTGFALAAPEGYKGLRSSEHKTPALPSTAVAQTDSEFEIKDWPRNLRT